MVKDIFFLLTLYQWLCCQQYFIFVRSIIAIIIIIAGHKSRVKIGLSILMLGLIDLIFYVCVVDFAVYQSAGACPVDWHWGEDTLHLRGGPGQRGQHQGFTLGHRGVHATGVG